jgi:hypothetical protein
MDRYVAGSLVGFLAALIVGSGSIFGFWVSSESLPVVMVEIMTLLVLLINSVLILRWVYKASSSGFHRRLAWLCLLSLVLCIGGDIVNFNFPQTTYRHGDVVKHDYLVDSVFFFGPGYAMLLAAVLSAVRASGQYSFASLAALLVAACALSGVLFASLYIPGAGTYVATMTGGYSLLITSVGMSGALLLASYGCFHAPLGLWAVSLGLVLAAVADAVIGAFWIYGNAGEGYFPLVRDVNWMLYIASQCLVIHLPRVMVKMKNLRASASSSAPTCLQ